MEIIIMLVLTAIIVYTILYTADKIIETQNQLSRNQDFLLKMLIKEIRENK